MPVLVVLYRTCISLLENLRKQRIVLAKALRWKLKDERLALAVPVPSVHTEIKSYIIIIRESQKIEQEGVSDHLDFHHVIIT